MVQNLTGGCLCGLIRFTATGVPDDPHTCSCHMCQRHSGAPTLVWVSYPKAAVLWDGPGVRQPCGGRLTSRSGPFVRAVDQPWGR